MISDINLVYQKGRSNMEKKLALFPMTRDMCAMARYPDLLQGYELSHLMIPGYMKMHDMDISTLDGGSCTGDMLSNYGLNILAECDILFIDYDDKMKNLDLYREVIADAKELGKEIILSRKLFQKLSVAQLSWPDEPPMTQNVSEDQLYEIMVPVITVLSQGPNTDQLAMELALRRHFTGLGYNVLQIGSGENGHFFGFKEIPDFLYEPRDAYEKILKFNEYVNKLAEQQQPELIIIGVPGATMKNSNKFLQGLGLLPLIIGSAIKSDLSILCMYYATCKKEYFKNFSQYGQYRLNGLISLFGISNVTMTSDDSSGMRKVNYTDLDSNFVLKSIKDEMNFDEYNLFNVLDNESVKSACEAAQNILTGHVRYMR